MQWRARPVDACYNLTSRAAASTRKRTVPSMSSVAWACGCVGFSRFRARSRSITRRHGERLARDLDPGRSYLVTVVQIH